MRIISDFKEPYDGLLRHGIGTDIYYRHQSEMQINDTWTWPGVNLESDIENVDFESEIFVVNNKMIPCIVVKTYKDIGGGMRTPVGEYGYTDHHEFMNCRFLCQCQKDSLRVRSYMYQFFAQRNRKIVCDAPIARCIYSKYITSKHLNSNYALELNPQLPKAFYSTMQPYEVYQEILYWFNNRSNPKKPMVQVSNDVRIQQHGFDKMSFRKRKQS